MAPTNEVHVTLHNASDLIPGESITATAVLTLTKPLSVSELTVTIFGRAFTRINRVYLISNLKYEWRGQGFFFKRIIVLIQTPTTLPAGTHTFPFTLQLPTATEPVRGNWHLFNKWKSRKPFPGKNTAHTLPGTMAMGGNQTWGSADAHIQYVIQTEVKRGPEQSFFTSVPKSVDFFTVASVPRLDLPQSPAAVPWHQLTRTIQTTLGPVNITCRLPRILTQRSNFPVVLKCDRPGLTLTTLKIKLYVVYLVRARNVILPEKRTKCTHVIQLVKSESGSIPLSTEFVVVKAPELSAAIPTTFLTYNLACLAHWMEIKYRVVAAGSTAVVKDKMKDISIQVQSWTGEKGVQRTQVGHGVGDFVGEVFSEEEYRRWSAEKKKNKKV